MIGDVIHYMEEKEEGLISSVSGDLYKFTKEDWRSEDNIAVNSRVDFVPIENFATEIYCIAKIKKSPKRPDYIDRKYIDYRIMKRSNAVDNQDYQGLYRSSNNSLLFGVLGGLAHKLHISLNFLRLIPVFLVFSTYFLYHFGCEYEAFVIYMIIFLYFVAYLYMAVVLERKIRT